jgi:hypothetical protein
MEFERKRREKGEGDRERKELSQWDISVCLC